MLRFADQHVLFYAIKNSGLKHWLPDKIGNSFGGFDFSNCMIDPACNSILLPLPPPQDIIEHFATPEFDWHCSVVGGSLLLSIQSTTEIFFDCCVQGSMFQIPVLRFHVASQDCDTLKKCGKLDQSWNQQALTAHGTRDVPQKTYALIGQTVLKQFNSILSQDCCIILKPHCDSVPSISDINFVLKGKAQAAIADWSEEFNQLKVEHEGDEISDIKAGGGYPFIFTETQTTSLA